MDRKRDAEGAEEKLLGTEAEVGFDLPVSEIVTYSKLQFAAAVVVLGLAGALLMFGPFQAKIDPLSCLACGYIFGVFCFQNVYIEWPVVPGHIIMLLAAAWAALVAPSGLNHPRVDLWEEHPARFGLWALDLCIMVAGYLWMVVGPAPEPLAAGSLKDKVFVITGCNTGIGYETARLIAEAGAKVVFACRSEDRARAAMKSIVDLGKVREDQLIFIQLDTSDFASVRKFATKLEESGLKPHTLIMNAGVMLSNRKLSVDGLEMTMATNHFGHFLLTMKMLPMLRATEARGEKPRIVVVGSNMSYMHSVLDFSECHRVSEDPKVREAFMQKPYEIFRAYGQSKLAQLHFTTELARRLQAQGSKMPVNQIHPGEVLTEVMRDMHWIIVKLSAIFRPVAMGFMKTPVQGSHCTMHVATSKNLETADQGTGQHFIHCHPAPLSAAGRDAEVAAKLWRLSEEVTGEASRV